MRKSKNEETGRLKAALARAGKNIKETEAIVFGGDSYRGVSLKAGKLRFEADEAFKTWVQLVFDLKIELPGNELLQSVFSIAGLDHEDPFHWKALLLAFCKYHFDPPKTKPKKSLFDIDRAYQDYMSVQKKYPEYSEEKICFYMKTHIAIYKKYKVESLRKMVREARSPHFNVALKYSDAPNVAVAIARSAFEKVGMSWTEERKAETIKILQFIFADELAAYRRNRSGAGE